MKDKKIQFSLYVICNKINSKIYFGQSKFGEKRWASHKKASMRKKINQLPYIKVSISMVLKILHFK